MNRTKGWLDVNFVLAFICAFSLFFAASLLRPARAEATELHSIYVRVHISPAQYKQWLDSPMKHMSDFDDWHEISPHWEDGWKERFYKWKFKTMGEMIALHESEMLAEEEDDWNSRPYVKYDAKEGVFTFAQILYEENYINFLLDLSAYRMFAAFKDTDEPDFLVIYPFLWYPGYSVIMEIDRGAVKFHTEKTAPESFKPFIALADEHFEKELASMEEE